MHCSAHPHCSSKPHPTRQHPRRSPRNRPRSRSRCLSLLQSLPDCPCVLPNPLLRPCRLDAPAHLHRRRHERARSPRYRRQRKCLGRELFRRRVRVLPHRRSYLHFRHLGFRPLGVLRSRHRSLEQRLDHQTRTVPPSTTTSVPSPFSTPTDSLSPAQMAFPAEVSTTL